jgi:uncharacterized protein (TIGR00369 family)
MSLTQAEMLGALQQISELIPFNHLLGVEVVDFGPEGCTVAFDKRPDLVGNVMKDVLHGGVISAVLDFTGGMTGLASVVESSDVGTLEQLGETFAGFGTIDLRVDYLRPGAGRRFIATGTTLRTGRRVVVTRMELHNDEATLIAVGTGSYVTG